MTKNKKMKKKNKNENETKKNSSIINKIVENDDVCYKSKTNINNMKIDNIIRHDI